ncbi:hypothetical protein [Bradyrhizobium sp. SZCCHNRI3042]|uniref:hypothetical protein n=1 Tax=Bradyrhizobium sp. SZCCHNRI3042 TaxID=3057291 RepID=UPI0029164F47|nr:hypothetical protein [Bradyrhizobium sp. SZCCHNRI3042]
MSNAEAARSRPRLERLEQTKTRNALRGILAEIERRRTKWDDETKLDLWLNTTDGRLGIKVRMHLLAQGIRTLTGKSNPTIAKAIHQRLTRTHARGGGPYCEDEPTNIDGRANWNAGTIKSWLIDRGVYPSPEFAEEMLAIMAAMLEEAIVAKQPELAANVAEKVNAKGLSLHAVLGTIFAGVNLPESGPTHSDLKSWIGPAFLVSPDAAEPKPLQEAAETARKFLETEQGSPKAAFVTGVPHSGKKTTLRYFLHDLTGRRFRLEGGTDLPVMAIALDDHTIDEFFDLVFDFYKVGHYSTFESARNPTELSLESKIGQIAAMAAETPACILIGDLAPIDDDEIVRAFSRDYIGQLIACLLHGHPQTRVLLSMRNAGNSVAESMSLGFEHKRIIELPAKFSPTNTEAMGKLFSQISEENEISGLSWRLAQISLQLMEIRIRRSTEKSALKKQLHICLEADQPFGFIRLIWDRFLTAEEKCLAGIIASSHDGVRLSVISRIAAALLRLEPQLDGILNPNIAHLKTVLASVEKLIESRKVRVQPLLRMEAEREEPLFSMDNAWRRLFLALWWNHETSTARLIHLLIACEAADQSRRMRLHGFAAGGSATFGRDVQAYHALVASVDTASIISSQGDEPTEEIDRPSNLEAEILPPLEVAKNVPDPKTVLQYCYFQLLKRDLEGHGGRTLAVLKDARTRLGLLLTLIIPETPWIPAEERELSTTLSSYGHFLAAFDAGTQIEILMGIAIAALGVEKYTLVSNAVHLGEAIYRERKGVGISKISFMRLLRAEVDAALLLGGNPDAIRMAGSGASTAFAIRRHDVQLTGVAIRLKHLLANVLPETGRYDRGLNMARGKLHAKLGEVYHVIGRVGAAKESFEQALKIEREIQRSERFGAPLSPVLGGRGARSYLRLLIDLAKRRHRKTSAAQFIFGDQLALPLPQHLPSNDPLLVEAQRLKELNARRSGHDRAADEIGLKIDGARLAILSHNFQKAYTLLDRADALKFAPGANLEILLELTAVRTRFFIDGAAFCFSMNAENSVYFSARQTQRIADYLKVEPDPEVLADALIAKAASSAAAFKKLVSLQEQIPHPYATYFDYLEALRTATESRRRDVDVPAVLIKARQQSQRAIDQMAECAYAMHLREAHRFHQSVIRALAHYGAQPA